MQDVPFFLPRFAANMRQPLPRRSKHGASERAFSEHRLRHRATPSASSLNTKLTLGIIVFILVRFSLLFFLPDNIHRFSHHP